LDSHTRHRRGEAVENVVGRCSHVDFSHFVEFFEALVNEVSLAFTGFIKGIENGAADHLWESGAEALDDVIVDAGPDVLLERDDGLKAVVVSIVMEIGGGLANGDSVGNASESGSGNGSKSEFHFVFEVFVLYLIKFLMKIVA